MHFLGDLMVPNSFKKKMKNCEELGLELANSEAPRTLRGKVERWMHLTICYPCWTYSKQIELINKTLRKKAISGHECDHISEKVASEVIDKYSKK